MAVNTHTDRAKYVGKEAKEVIGRTPGSIVAVRPLKDGVIADFETRTILLQEFIRKNMRGKMFARARVIICIPSVSRQWNAVQCEAADRAGAKPVLIVEEPMAATIGAGLPTTEPIGCMVVDIGGGTSEVAVIALGGIVVSQRASAVPAMSLMQRSSASKSDTTCSSANGLPKSIQDANRFRVSC